MRGIIYYALLLLPVACTGQDLFLYKDSINKFEIGIPIGWRYGTPKDHSVIFMAYRLSNDTTDRSRENLNINILSDDEGLNKSYKRFLASIGEATGFRLIEEGDTTINGRQYKWLIETHKNHLSDNDMHNYVFFTIKGNEVLILTMVTFSDRFSNYKPLFDKIAKSLKY